MATDSECLDLKLSDKCCKVLNLLKSNPKKYYTARDIEMNYDGPVFQTLDPESQEKKSIKEDIEKEVLPCLEELENSHLLEKKTRNGETEYRLSSKSRKEIDRT